jgi:AcrR family transcriptional regulator
MTATSATPARYGTGRVRLLSAARQVFVEKGYRGATTRDIAIRAELTEPMLFRYFGSKAALIEEAALQPLVGFIDEYVAEWDDREHGTRDPIAEVKEFFSRLFDVLASDRQLLIAIHAAVHFDENLEPAAARLEHAFGRVLELFERMLDEEITVRGLHSPDRPALARVMVGLVMSLALHADWLRMGAGAGRLPPDRVLNEAARVIVHGVTRP